MHTSNKILPFKLRRIIKLLVVLFFILTCSILAIASSDDSFATVDDQFTVDGVKYKITSEGDTNTIEVRGISSESSSVVTIPSEVTNDSKSYHVNAIGNNAFEHSRIYSIKIPDGVTSIGEYAFSNCTSLSSIKIPDSVTSIGEYAFFNCCKFNSINIPGGVTSIGEGAFAYCTNITKFILSDSNNYFSVDDQNILYNKEKTELISCSGGHSGLVLIPNGVITINGSAFFGCPGLTSVTMSNSVTSIGNSAFSGCTGLTSVIMSKNITEIGDWAFNNCNALGSINIPDGVNSMGMCAFADCSSLTSFVMPDSVTDVGEDLFFRCKNLETVVLSESLTYISDSMFSCCDNFKNVVIPDSITRIGESAFAGCKLESIIIPNNLTHIDGFAFEACEILGSIVIPDSVTYIGMYAFNCCYGLTSITLGDGLTSIGNSAFNSCTGITSISIPANLTSIGNSVFSKCSSLTSITIPDNVTSIDKWAFEHCHNLISITGGNYVTSIGDNAFLDCPNLTYINIGSRVEYIGNNAFSDCTFYSPNGIDVISPQTSSNLSGSVYSGSSSEKLVQLINITWLVDGVKIIVGPLEYGTIIPAPEDPVKGPDAQYSDYTFSKWKAGEVVYVAGVTTATSNLTFIAQFTPVGEPKSYAITWIVEGTSITEDVVYGLLPLYAGTPSKTGTEDKIFIFVRWNNPVVEVIGDATYTATFDEAPRIYVITWIVDGIIDKTEELAYGTAPNYGVDPTKTQTAEHTFTFTGWSPSITAVTETKTYTAQFSETINSYTIKWMDGGAEIDSMTLVYGTDIPKKANLSNYSDVYFDYIFSKWECCNDGTMVIGDVTYVAVFDESIKLQNNKILYVIISAIIIVISLISVAVVYFGNRG